MAKISGYPIDWKFEFDAISIHNGKPYTEYEALIFLCKDLALVDTLHFYKKKCIKLGCKKNQLKAIDLLIIRVSKWQENHQSLLKIADIEGKEALVPPRRPRTK